MSDILIPLCRKGIKMAQMFGSFGEEGIKMRQIFVPYSRKGIKMSQIFASLQPKESRCVTSLFLSAKRNEDTRDFRVFPRQKNSFSAKGIKISLIFVPL